MSWLPEPLLERLALEAPTLRALVGGLSAKSPATRLAALDAVLDHLLAGGRRSAPSAAASATLAPEAEAAIPYLLALATAPRYPGAAPLLARLLQLSAAIDDPPRSLAGAAGSEAARRVHDVLGAGAGALLQLARASHDPQAARLAIAIAARHPDRDHEVEPLLVALLSGARDDEEQARLLYALARIQAARGAPFHRRIAEALASPEATPQRLAVALAVLDDDPPEPARGRAEALVVAAPGGASDPRAYGRQLRAAPG